MKKLVGDFNENELKSGIDKQRVVEEKRKTGLDYVLSKIIKKNGVKYLRVWVCDLEEWKNEPLL